MEVKMFHLKVFYLTFSDWPLGSETETEIFIKTPGKSLYKF